MELSIGKDSIKSLKLNKIGRCEVGIYMRKQIDAILEGLVSSRIEEDTGLGFIIPAEYKLQDWINLSFKDKCNVFKMYFDECLDRNRKISRAEKDANSSRLSKTCYGAKTMSDISIVNQLVNIAIDKGFVLKRDSDSLADAIRGAKFEMKLAQKKVNV